MRLVLSILLAAMCIGGSCGIPSEVPQKRGDFAFGYAASYNARQMKWFSRFKLVSTGEYLPADQVKELNAAGSKLVRYEWSVAFYLKPTDVLGWEHKLLADHPNWVLNPGKGLYGYAGSMNDPAYYFDPSIPEMRKWRIETIIKQAREHHYNGWFFDTTTFNSVHPDAQAIFKKLHPDKVYDDYMAMFLGELKAAAPDMIIFTNQGYRDHAHYLPYADYDLSESYMTQSIDGPKAKICIEGKGIQEIWETHIIKWYADIWGDSASSYIDDLIRKPIQKYGYKSIICHYNYGVPKYIPTVSKVRVDGKDWEVYKPTLDREAIYYGVAAALLFNQTSYYAEGDETRYT